MEHSNTHTATAQYLGEQDDFSFEMFIVFVNVDLSGGKERRIFDFNVLYLHLFI